MCRAIKTLHNFSPPATNDEIRASSLQFVRKLSGFTRPSKANETAFNRAVDDVAHAAQHLLDSLVTNAPPRDREAEVMKVRARSAKRFGSAQPIATGHNHNLENAASFTGLLVRRGSPRGHSRADDDVQR